MEEINISELIRYYLSKIFIVVIGIVFGFLMSWYYTNKIQVPLYKSEAKIVLTNQSATITQNDVVLNKNLVSTYREIIKSRRILSQVIENLKLDMTLEELNKKVKVTSASDTELIIISVSTENANLSKEVANQIANIFKDEIVDIYNIENITIVDKAIIATKPYNINVLKQYVVGVAVGIFLSSSLIVLMFYFDDTIKAAEEIETKLGLNVLSQVPKYRSNKKKKNIDSEGVE